MSEQKRRPGWWVGSLVLIMMVYAAFTFSSQSEDLYLINLQIKQLEQKIQREEDTKNELLKLQDELSSDESIEKIAREKLGMVKDGERVFVDTNK